MTDIDGPDGLGSRGPLKAVRRAIGVGVVAGSCCIVLFFGVSALTLLVPRQQIVEEIRAGFLQGTVVAANYPPPEDYWRLGRDQWTDCAVLQMTMPGDGSFPQELVSPRRFSQHANFIYQRGPLPRGEGPCPQLQDVVQSAPSAAELHTYRYHRYLHGSTILSRIVLAFGTVGALRLCIKVLTLAAAALALGIALWALMSGHRRCPYASATLVLVAGFLACFGIREHAASLSHGPPAALFVLALTIVPFWDQAKRRSRLLIFAAVFGSLTAILEFLDGGAPLGLALILGVSALDALDRVESAEAPSTTYQTILDGFPLALAYTTALVSTFAYKVILSIVVFGAEGAASFFGQLGVRVGGATWTLISTAEALHENLGVIFPLGGRVYEARGATSFRLLLILTAAAGIVALLSMTLKQKHLGAFLLAASSFAVVPVWYAVFRNHTTVHAWFMVRLLAWPVAFSLSLAVFWMVSAWKKRVPARSL